MAGVGLTTSLVFAQTQTVRGVIVDAGTGEPVIGANVIVKGHSGVGASTNIDGKFTLNAPKGATHLIVSYIGYKKTEVAIRPNLTIKLESDTEAIDEVVVLGYGSARKVASVVSSVVTLKAKDLEAKPVANPLEALQGKVSGLQMFVSSGEPSEVASMRLRGSGSLGASSAPLFILDGAPVTTGTIRSLNANDIENVQVLKDAAATSIYGARAANGVIYITTKRGKTGDTAQVTVRGQYGVSNLANRDYFNSMMNSDELAAFSLDFELRKQSELDNIRKQYPHDTRWADYTYQKDRPSYQTDIAVSGGAGSTRYYISAARQYQEGLRHGSEYGKNAFRVNLNTSISKAITLGTNNSLTMDKYRTNPYNGTQLAGGLSSLILPWYTPYDKDGNEVDWIEGLEAFTSNYQKKKSVRDNKHIIINSASFIQIKPTADLTLRSQLAYEHKSYGWDQLRLPSHEQHLGNGIRKREHAEGKTLTWTNTAEYKFNLGKQHNLVALAGHEYVDYDEDSFAGYGEGLTNDLLTTIDQVTKEKDLEASVSQYAFLSFFGRLSYDYADRYFADLTVRNDASSRFGKNNRNATFWSLGLMWRAKKENFLKNVKWLNDLSVKLSVGTQGNAEIGNYNTYALASVIGKANGVSGLGLTSPGNPDLSWEKQLSRSIGFEGRLFGKLNFNIELYNRLTSSMLIAVPYPHHIGFLRDGATQVVENVGKYQNTGIDLSLSYDVLRNKRNDYLNLWVNLNYNKDKVVELFQGQQSWIIPNTGVAWVVGQPLMYYWPIFAGVNPDNGDATWYLPNEEDRSVKTTDKTTNKFSSDLEQNTGIKRFPFINGGFGFKAQYRGVSLDADFAMSLGKSLIVNDAFFYENPTRFGSYNQRKTVTDYWKKPGDVTRFPRKDVQFTQFDSRLIDNASFVRLKNITLGYSLPASLLKGQSFVKGAKFYVQGRNLLTFTKFNGPDPEVDDNLTMGANPNTKQVMFGFELNF